MPRGEYWTFTIEDLLFACNIVSFLIAFLGIMSENISKTANTVLNKLYKNPNYAIVKIPESSNVLQLYQLLLTNGFPEVSFVNEVRENAFLPSSDIVDMIQQQIAAAAAPNLVKSEQSSDLTIPTQNGSQPSPNSLLEITQSSSNGSDDDVMTNTHGVSSRASFAKISPSSSRIPSPFPYVARPRGSRAAPNEDSSAYAVCQLCSNKIMASRLSNLTNHVRRHASLKQYQCRHCVYAHNEMAKVRLHMQHNHRDFDSQPIDAICPEMQLQWNLLMEQCFPGHAKRISNNTTIDTISKTTRNINIDGQYACVECGEVVMGDCILEHLHERHQADCVPYSCAECGYQSSNQWKVRLHITVKHQEKAAEVAVNTLPAGSNYTVFIRRFFPDIPGDDEEEKMVAELRENSVKLENIASKQDLPTIVLQKPTTIDPKEPIKETIRCQICHRNVPSAQPLFNLLSHAKRHYNIKQFKCPECNHSTVDLGAIRTHMAIKHPSSNDEPIDNFNEELHTSWINTMKQCFPKLIPKIESHQFRFEYYQQLASEESNKTNSGHENDVEVLENGKSTSPPPMKRLRERRSTGNLNIVINKPKN